MAEYTLHCFAESGHAFKVALMLQACRLEWTPRFVSFFDGETRTPEYRARYNEMGEVPVLEHDGKILTQSGVILDYLAERTRKFGPKSDDERREILRWILFDNHKLTSSIASLRYLIRFAKTGETPVTEYLRGRGISALKVLDHHLAEQPYVIGKRATIADFSLCSYLYFGDELTVPLDPHINVLNWLDRIKAIPGWKHPYDLMQRAYKG